MGSTSRRFGLSALAATGLAAAILVGPAAGSTADGWTPVTRGLSAPPSAILPATVSAAHPVTVVSTALDARGRPVITRRTATDPATAAGLVRAGQRAPRAVAVELDAPTSALAGTDPYRSLQYGLDTIRSGTAWASSTGSGVTVAVLDTGVDAAHADLAGQVRPGYNALDGTTGTSSDGYGHGTHVAGIVAAATGNGIGVAGTAPDAKILPVQVMDSTGRGTMGTLASGIVWAADHGAAVVNLSLGSDTQVTAVTDAIAYARSTGVTVVAAAGNSRTAGNAVSYPAADPGVIAVAATDPNDGYGSFSNSGSYVDVSAPGVQIASTYNDGGYVYESGTSMAAPAVAALAALVDAARPGLTPDEIEQIIESTSVDLGAPGKDSDYGYGRIDAAAAVAAATATAATATAAPAISGPATSPTTAPTTSPTTAPTSPTTGPPIGLTTEPTTSPTTGPPAEPPAGPTASPPSRPAPALITPVVTMTGWTRTVDYGSTINPAFSVRVDGVASAGRPVRACVATGAATTFVCTATTTSPAGTVGVPLTVTGSYRVQLVVPATATTTAVSSAVYPVSAQARPRLAVRTPTTLTATVGGAAGQTVQIQRRGGRSPGAWTTWRTYAAVPAATIAGVAPGYRYRLVVASSGTVIGATSPAVSL